MPKLHEEHLEKYLQQLRRLAFVKKADVRLHQRPQSDAKADGVLAIHTPQSTHHFDLEIKRAPVTSAAIDAVIGRYERGQPEKPPRALMLFAPHIGRPLAEYLVGKNVNFVDEAGNCHVRLGTSFMALVEGRRAVPRAALGRGLGLSGHLALFAILAKPEVLDSSIRTLADRAGVSKTAVEHLLARLTEEGAIVRGRNRRHLQNHKLLLDRWLNGYATLVRPRLLVGQYRTPDADPSSLEARLEQVLPEDTSWGWGGGAAANRLTEFYRGGRTVLHLAEPSQEIIRRLKALPSKEGDLVVLRTPGHIAFDGAAPRTVHPLLVYTELLTEGTERAREAAEMLRERFLPWL
jgi:hypothetical protein